AARYGLRYASPKTAESTVLYHLKRNGISRRDKAEHIRKVTEEMVDDWVKRYEAGESLKQIAGNELSPVTVFLHLKKRGIQLRDKIEAQIVAVSKHKKTPFSGDILEKARMLGFVRGDAWVTRHGRAIRVRGGSTHPAFLGLFKGLFGNYGPAYVYPKEAKLTGYEWCIDVDLDRSFNFLLEGPEESNRLVASDTDFFLNFLAGFFDAEGSIYYHKKYDGGAFELSIKNMDIHLLELLNNKLQSLGYSSNLSVSRQEEKGRCVQGADHIWSIRVWRRDDVVRLLASLPLMHSEKIAKREIASRLPTWPSKESRAEVLSKWEQLLQSIKKEVKENIEEARETMMTSGNHIIDSDERGIK
ncbi:MAG: hypothetical protein JRN09_02975, partial [Nitrososphaerota archaeon]|nr:hypothetical protein [Nitrososphaerota archaeon]